jgi:hypothetical protein
MDSVIVDTEPFTLCILSNLGININVAGKCTLHLLGFRPNAFQKEIKETFRLEQGVERT